MARSIKITLTLNNTSVETLAELKENFNIEELIYYFSTGGLLKFLQTRGYNEYATKILIVKKDDKNLSQKLYKIFLEVDAPKEFQNLDVTKVLRSQKNKKILEEQGYTDEKILSKAENAAFDQEDLDELISEGVSEIYLCGKKFKIPLDARNKTYIGIGDVVAVINSEKLIDFDALNIKFQKISFDEKYENLKKSPAALYEFGKNYYDSQNYKKAVEWFEKAANSGNADAMYIMKMLDESTPLDKFYFEEGRRYYIRNAYKEAFEYFRKAADFGNSDAMYYLGCFYKNGEGVTKDILRARFWYKKAAERGDAHAEWQLARLGY